MKAKKKPLDTVKPADLGVDVAPHQDPEGQQSRRRAAPASRCRRGRPRQTQERSQGDLTWNCPGYCRTRQQHHQGCHPQHRDGRAASAAVTSTCWSPARIPVPPPGRRRQIAGVSRCCMPTTPTPNGLAENVAAQVLALASGYSHILFPGDRLGKNIAPRVAAKLDVGQISDHQGSTAPTPSSARSMPATPSPPCRAWTRPRCSPLHHRL